MLLKSDEGCADFKIAEHVGSSDRTFLTLGKQYCGGGIKQATFDLPCFGRPKTLTEGQRCTLELLCEQAVKQGLVESVGKSELALWLKEHDLKPWRKKLGVYPS